MRPFKGDVCIASLEDGFEVYDISESAGSSACWGNFTQFGDALTCAYRVAGQLNARFDASAALANARRAEFIVIDGGRE